MLFGYGKQTSHVVHFEVQDSIMLLKQGSKEASQQWSSFQHSFRAAVRGRLPDVGTLQTLLSTLMLTCNQPNTQVGLQDCRDQCSIWAWIEPFDCSLQSGCDMNSQATVSVLSGYVDAYVPLSTEQKFASANFVLPDILPISYTGFSWGGCSLEGLEYHHWIWSLLMTRSQKSQR